jgi:hypothetical protein
MKSARKSPMTLAKALTLLRQPNARLVQSHTNDSDRGFYILPQGGRVSDLIAKKLLERNDIQPYDDGLFPGHPQSWRRGNWRDW